MLYDSWAIRPVNETLAQTLLEQRSLHPLVCRILAQLQLPDAEAVYRFLHPSLSDLHDPFAMADMSRAVDRLHLAIERGESILLFGDYDVDGVCGVALCYAYLHPLYPKLHYCIPRRETDGYGFGQAGVECAVRCGCSLVITIDCGIRDDAAVRSARELGIDVLVCDHHVPPGCLPPAAAVLNPLRPDCPYPFKGLSGGGVAFKLLQGYSVRFGQAPERLFDLLDLVCLSTACDLMPMVGENRALVHAGLEHLRRTRRPGLRALLRHVRIGGAIGVRDLVYRLGPLLNAPGRVDDAQLSVQLLLATDPAVADALIGRLSWLNKQRRHADRSAFAAACRRWEVLPDAGARRSIVLHDAAWEPGVLGIVAGRMAERFGKPAVLLGSRNGAYTGSARSAGGVALDSALDACSGLLQAWGGHAHAAGLRLPPQHLDAFAHAFEQAVRLQQPDGPPPRVLPVSAQIGFSDISLDLADQLERLAPHGPEQRSPVFTTCGVQLAGPPRRLGARHVQVDLMQEGRRLQAIGFGLAESVETLCSRPFDVAFGIRTETWQGHRLVQLQIKDVKV